jgi:hypothetical protein
MNLMGVFLLSVNYRLLFNNKSFKLVTYWFDQSSFSVRVEFRRELDGEKSLDVTAECDSLAVLLNDAAEFLLTPLLVIDDSAAFISSSIVSFVVFAEPPPPSTPTTKNET